jgi:hypothetical protein
MSMRGFLLTYFYRLCHVELSAVRQDMVVVYNPVILVSCATLLERAPSQPRNLPQIHTKGFTRVLDHHEAYIRANTLYNIAI